MNNINLTGRLTKDPELKQTPNGVNYARFTLAVSRGKVKEGQQATDFIPCVAWQKTAEILVKYCKKGKLLGLNGRLSAQQYEKDGQKKIGFEVIALSLEMLGGNESKVQESTAPAAPRTQIEASTEPYITDDGIDNVELPFEI